MEIKLKTNRVPFLALILFVNCSCSLLKDLYYDQDAADKDKKDEEAAKKKANRPSKSLRSLIVLVRINS